MVFCVLIKQITPPLSLRFVFVIVVIIRSLQFIHVLSIIQNVDINCGNVSVWDCKNIAVSGRIIIWKFISVRVKRYHKTITVRAVFIKLIYGQLIWCTNYRFKANTCIICIVQFQNLGLGIVYRNRNVKTPVAFIFVVARICSIFFIVIFWPFIICFQSSYLRDIQMQIKGIRNLNIFNIFLIFSTTLRYFIDKFFQQRISLIRFII